MTTAIRDLGEVIIVDADSHITEPPGVWVDRMPSKFADIAPRVELNPETNHNHWRIGNHWLWPVGFMAQAGWKEYPPSVPSEYEECEPGSYDAPARLKRLDDYGLDIQIVYPNLIGWYAAHMIELGAEFAALCVKAYNDFLLDWCAADPKRLVPIAMLPFWDLEASVTEMRRCAALGFKGVLFANCLERVHMPSFIDPHWDPIYATAQELDLPINFHIGFAEIDLDKMSASGIEARRTDVAELEGSAAALRLAKLLMGQTDWIGKLLMSGVCERYPRLKFVAVETGFGHLPFYLETLDWQVKGHGSKGLPLLPSEYFRRQCYGTFWFESLSLPLLKHYPDNFMFSTDYPHPTSLSPGPCGPTDLMPSEYVAQKYVDLDPALAKKVLSENAAAVYKL